MLRISEFLISFFVFLLTKLLFGVIRDLNGLWCSTENIYSIYWRSMPALLFDFELRLRLCACRASVSVYGCESAPKYLADTFGAPSCCLASSRFVSLSLSLPLCSFCMLNRFYSGTAFDGSQFTNAEGAKKRGRKSREEHNNANNNSLAPSLFLPLSLFLSHSPCAFTCPCACPCVFRLYDFWIFPNIFELYSAQYFYFYASLFICFSLVDFFLLILFTAIFNFQLLICQKTEIFASQNSHTYMIHIYPWLFFIDFSTSCLQAKEHTNVYFNCFLFNFALIILQ